MGISPPVFTVSTTSLSTTCGVGRSFVVDKSSRCRGRYTARLVLPVERNLCSYYINLQTSQPCSSLSFEPDATCVSESSCGQSYKVTNKSCFRGLSCGQNLELRFELCYSGCTEPEISGITFNGDKIL